MGPQAQTRICSAGTHTHTHKTHGDLALGLLADMSGGLGGAPRTPVAQACRQCQLGTHTRPQIAVFGLSRLVIRSTLAYTSPREPAISVRLFFAQLNFHVGPTVP